MVTKSKNRLAELKCTMKLLSNIANGLIVAVAMFCMTGCNSPEEKIQKDLDKKVEQFKIDHSNYIVEKSLSNVYNINNNVNYLANEQVRELAFSYETNKSFEQNSREKYETSMISYYDSVANCYKDSLEKVLKNTKDAPLNGIWVYHEIVYKLYYGSDCYVEQRVYQYADDGETLLYQTDVQFGNIGFQDILNITNTQENHTAQSDYEIKRGMIIALVIALVIGVLFGNYKRKEPQRIQKREAEKEQRRIREQQRKLAAQEKWEKWRQKLEEREEKYGKLTKQIYIDSEEKNCIFVYETAKVVYIKNKKFSFSDILSCNVEEILFKKGTETRVTTPDKHEMATQEILYGMGKKYNVKTTTVVNSTPDQYKYIVYIGVRSISDPQIQISLDKQNKANEIRNLMNVIIEMSKQ